MSHEPAHKAAEDPASQYKMRLGVRMFMIYALIYAGFVAINVVKPVLMEKKIILGLNLAVVYGFGLIIIAMVLAIIYNTLCTNKERQMAANNTGQSEQETKCTS